MIIYYTDTAFQKKEGDGVDEFLKSRFIDACAMVEFKGIERSTIGTLGEKCLHLILKYTFEPRGELHEIKVGSFYADIKNEDGIVEIHTRSFNTLRKKLDVFLKEGRVRIVYPIPRIKRIIWIDPESGEITTPRKSPKIGSYFDCFRELYKIKHYLDNENLIFTPVLIDMVEYRNLNGWSKDRKKGASRFDRIPTELVDFIDIKTTEDYKKLIPAELTSDFSVKDFAKAAKISAGTASLAVNVLRHLGVIFVKEKKGRAYIYSCM